LTGIVRGTSRFIALLAVRGTFRFIALLAYRALFVVHKNVRGCFLLECQRSVLSLSQGRPPGGPVSQGSNVVTAALEADVSALRQVNQMLRDQLDDMRSQRDKWKLTKNQHGEAYTRRPVDLLGRDPTADLGDAGAPT
jgi:hypothetical protein